MSNKQLTVVIIGGGPAGLTASYELAKNCDMRIVIFEADSQVGGISKTVDYKGNKIDIGGHRFFSKSEWVLDWWQNFLPISADNSKLTTTYQNNQKTFKISRSAKEGEPQMLVRPRKSRIYFDKKLFDYPLKLNFNTIRQIGFFRSINMLISLLYRKAIPVKQEKNLEDFFINRFGEKLYRMFFRDYTRKVWGKPCDQISAEWGRQRVKGLGIRKILKHYITSLLFPQRQAFGSKNTEQTLTEYFLYPQKGPGQLWESVAEACVKLNVEINCCHKVQAIGFSKNKVSHVEILNAKDQTTLTQECDVVISTMPVRSLIKSFQKEIPSHIEKVAHHLEYRDFLIVGILLDDLKLKDKEGQPIRDNWLYIQDSSVQMGRMQLFHNWSSSMTAREGDAWIGAEYFCQEGDELWSKSDEELIQLAVEEAAQLGIIEAGNVLDGVVVRMPKSYPSYVGSYQDFDILKDFLNQIQNLWLIGRNGTHKYNNQDHSMLTAKEAVSNILSGKASKENVWEVNTDQEYHEENHR